jgi:ribonuclease HI
MPLVTMFTDASFNRERRIGVWAMWAKLDGKTIRYSGQVRGQVPQIGTAELAAIANGLFCISKKFDLVGTVKIIAQTDSQESIDAIKNAKHPRPADQKLVDHIKEFLRTNGWLLDLRHIKGHKGNATPRHAVNNWCDKECRRRMGIALRTDSQLTLPLENAA